MIKTNNYYEIIYNNYKNENGKFFLKFICFSVIGIFMFMTPLQYKGESSIPVAIMAHFLCDKISSFSSLILTFLLVISALGGISEKLLGSRFTKSAFISSLFKISGPWLVIRILAATFAMVVYLDLGIEYINSENTAKLILNELLPLIICVFFFAGIFMPFLMNFGLLEFIGVLMTPIMRPLFKVPGRAAVDCVSSWLGDCAIAIMLTSKQYETKHYTQKEAAIVGTTFSAVSITFALIIISEVQLSHYFFPFYLTVMLVGFVCAIIIPRIPPLSLKSDLYIDGSTKNDESSAQRINYIQEAIKQAISQSKRSDNIYHTIKEGIDNCISMIIHITPAIMGVGTLSLILAEYSSIFDYLSIPFISVFEMFNIPHAAHAAKSLVLGITDMFIPALISSDLESELTRFVIASISVCQLIYMSEVGALLLSSKIPVKLYELMIIFMLRTIISVPIVCGIGHLLF